MKKKVGILTFHASHNYGSMLQAYALQQVIINMGLDCEIINFRTNRQKDFYRPPFMRGCILGKIKRFIFYFPYIFSLMKKQQLFETFMKKYLVLTPIEYSTLEDLSSEDFEYDYYISGSDQIWNTYCFDFDWSYFLPFVKKGKKIAYAVSIGSNSWRRIDTDKIINIKKLLLEYNAVSLREKDSSDRFKKEFNLDFPTMLDPTLLFPSSFWEKMVGEKPIISGDYILLYSPWFDSRVFYEAKKISSQFNLKIVVTQIYNNNKEDSWLKDDRFEEYISAGPIEFLNLCRFATYVIGSSFHLVVFSIIFRKPFFIVDGMNDSRINNILKLTNLENRAVDPNFNNNYLIDIDFTKAIEIINRERKVSLEWLKNSLGILHFDLNI